MSFSRWKQDGPSKLLESGQPWIHDLKAEMHYARIPVLM